MGTMVGRTLSGRLALAGLLTSVCYAAFNNAAGAQNGAVTTLPRIDVVSSRVVVGRDGPGSGTPGTDAAADGVASRIVGTSTSVITAADIERSPVQSLPDLLAQQAGVQVQHLFGGVNGSRDAVDLRGFGASSHSNVLVLVNGRRYQDFDLQGFDYSSIPVNSIERIEITRGNSGTVLYGDGAVGGVINIVTKAKPQTPFAGRIEGAFGSFRYREGRVSASGSSGPWSASVFGNMIDSNGHRRNSDLWQRNAVANLDYTASRWSAYLNIAADTQRQNFAGGLPPRSTTLPFTLATPSETNTPFDNGSKQGVNVTTGVVTSLGSNAELILDGGVRRKFQQATFYDYFPSPAFTYNAAGATPSSYVDTVMTTSSLTPRLDATHRLFGVQNRLLTGIDLYNTQYNSDRSQRPGGAIIHHYNIRQTTAAWYAMNKAAVRPDTDVSFGARVQRNMIQATDDYNAAADPNAGGYSSSAQAPSLSTSEWQYAAHIGGEYRVLPTLALFARAARAFRLGNADERVGAGNPFALGAPANFSLKTQTSYDFEGGFRINSGRFNFMSSVYDMYLTNEIHFLPAFGQNINLDPTRRTGWENMAAYQITNDVRLRGGVTYTRAVFRSGTYAGNYIPLVSPWTGNAGFTWDIVKKALILDVNARFWSQRRMDNDQPNAQPLIPANATVDMKLGGEYDRFFWSAAVLNVFNVNYFDYAIASGGSPASIFGGATPPTIGAYSAYPQPGRSFMVRAGARY